MIDDQEARIRRLRDAPLNRPELVSMTRARFTLTMLGAFWLGVAFTWQVASVW